MKLLRVAAALLAVLPLMAQAQPVKTRDVLERVVIVERHGVRPPTKAPADLAKFSEQAWPEWSVKPGELSEHGAKAIALMGAALKRTYAKDGLFTATGCPTGLFLWSDSADQRTRASGDAVLNGLGCTQEAHHLAAGTTDPLFDPIEAGLCPIEPEKGRDAAEAALKTTLMRHAEAYAKGRQVLQSVLTPNGCGKPGQRACLIGEGQDVVTVKDGEVRLDGPLREASTLSENLLLEYSEGKPLTEVGWGRGAEALKTVLPLHNFYADVMRRTPYFASRRGSLLAQQVLDLLNNRPSRFQGAAPVPVGAKFVLFLGHDTNLSNMSGFLDAAWSLPGQPDHTAPNTAIAFERWRRSDGRVFVKLRVFYQTLEELRGLSPLAEARSIVLPVCAGGSCSLDELTRQMGKTIAQPCLH